MELSFQLDNSRYLIILEHKKINKNNKIKHKVGVLQFDLFA